MRTAATGDGATDVRLWLDVLMSAGGGFEPVGRPASDRRDDLLLGARDRRGRDARGQRDFGEDRRGRFVVFGSLRRGNHFDRLLLLGGNLENGRGKILDLVA